MKVLKPNLDLIFQVLKSIYFGGALTILLSTIINGWGYLHLILFVLSPLIISLIFFIPIVLYLLYVYIFNQYYINKSFKIGRDIENEQRDIDNNLTILENGSNK